MPAKKEKMLLFFAYSFNDTLSARIALVTTLVPAAASPCNALPKIRTGKAFVGAEVQIALPIIMMNRAVSMAASRPNVSAIWPQKGMNAAEQILKADIIQFIWEICPGFALVPVPELHRAVHTKVRGYPW